MNYIISIKDTTQNGKILLSMLRNFSKTTRSVEFLSPIEVDDLEDQSFLKMMEKDSKSGKADSKKVLKKLGIK